MTKKPINLNLVREADEELRRIAREHPELLDQSEKNAERLFQGVFAVTVDEKKLTFSLNEACELLDLSRSTLWRAIKAGKLKGAKTGKDYRFSRADLEAYWRELGGSVLFENKQS